MLQMARLSLNVNCFLLISGILQTSLGLSSSLFKIIELMKINHCGFLERIYYFITITCINIWTP